MALMVTDAYTDRDSSRCSATACGSWTRRADATHGVVVHAGARRRSGSSLLEALDREQKAAMEARDARATHARAGGAAAPADAPAHYFRMMKELALLGYFTSEIGYTQAMRYVESPGRFDPCAPHTPGEKIWASHA